LALALLSAIAKRVGHAQGECLMKATENLIDKVAIVDPCFDDYEPLLTSFEAEAWRAELCATGEEALRFAGAGAPPLWFVNVQLPDMAGATLLKLIRRRQRWISIVLVGDTYSQADELAARTAGATAYLCKPVTANWIQCFRTRSRVCGAMRKHRTLNALAMRPP
jgi:DNA-binding response OmpR family regulator